MSGFVGAQHEFHDAAFVQGWADRFVPTPPRIALFDGSVIDRAKPTGWSDRNRPTVVLLVEDRKNAVRGVRR